MPESCARESEWIELCWRFLKEESTKKSQAIGTKTNSSDNIMGTSVPEKDEIKL